MICYASASSLISVCSALFHLHVLRVQNKIENCASMNPRLSADVDISELPWEVKEKLFQLQLEFSEGDITQKGYEKKRRQLLGPYLPKERQGSLSFDSFDK